MAPTEAEAGTIEEANEKLVTRLKERLGNKLSTGDFANLVCYSLEASSINWAARPEKAREGSNPSPLADVEALPKYELKGKSKL